jgi:hypothetical protein
MGSPAAAAAGFWLCSSYGGSCKMPQVSNGIGAQSDCAHAILPRPVEWTGPLEISKISKLAMGGLLACNDPAYINPEQLSLGASSPTRTT